MNRLLDYRSPRVEKSEEKMSDIELMEYLHRTLKLDIVAITRGAKSEGEVDKQAYDRRVEEIKAILRQEFVKRSRILDPGFDVQIENFLHDIAFHFSAYD